MTSTEAGDIRSPTNVKKVVMVIETVSECKSVAKGRNGFIGRAHAPDYLQTGLPQATEHTDAVSNENLAVRKLPSR